MNISISQIIGIMYEQNTLSNKNKFIFLFFQIIGKMQFFIFETQTFCSANYLIVRWID